MTFSTIPCRIEKRAGTQPLCTRSSGDRAFGSGPKGRRFESCRVQQRSLDFSGLLFYAVRFHTGYLPEAAEDWADRTAGRNNKKNPVCRTKAVQQMGFCFYLIKSSAFAHSSSASTTLSKSSLVWSAERMVRRRAVPLGTMGNCRACA